MTTTRIAIAPTKADPVDVAASTTVTTMTRPRSHIMDLINEALSRARMRQPQNVNSEAHRSARRVAMRARRQAARELGEVQAK